MSSFTTLSDAWQAAGGDNKSYDAVGHEELDPYEEEKLTAIGLDLSDKKTLAFCRKAKGLLGRQFTEIAADEEQRRHTAEVAGNPAGRFVALVTHRVSEATGRAQAAAQLPSKKMRMRKTPSKKVAQAQAEPDTPVAATVKPPPPARSEGLSVVLPCGFTEKFDKKKYHGQRVVDLGSRPDAANKLWCSTALVQLTLPHTNPGTDRFSRNNGRKYLSLVAGQYKNRALGLPYGVRPRLLLHYVTSRVAQCESREIELPNTIHALHKELGLTMGLKNYIATSEMAESLFSCLFTVGDMPRIEPGMSPGRRRLAEMCGVRDHYIFAEHIELFWDAKSREEATGNGGLFPSFIRLSSNFHALLKERTFPVHRNAILALQQSSLALDLYAWLCWRNFALISTSNDAVTIPLASSEFSTGLVDQFGAQFKELKHFTYELRKALRSVRAVWHGTLNCEILADRLILKPSTVQIGDGQKALK
jgi:hypothetical protein